MRKNQRNLLAAGILLASGALAFRGSRRSGPCRFGLTYVERITGGANTADELPLVVFLHPRGAKPSGFTSFAGRIKGRARVLFPGGPIVKSGRHSWATVGTKGDQAELTAQIRSSGQALADFISEAQRCLPTTGMPVVTGTSQGGNMAYYMASQYPHTIRGAVAVAGWLPETLWNPNMAPTFGGHGEYDTTVPYARTAAFWSAMQNSGADLGTKTFPVAHTTQGMGSWWGARVNQLLGAYA